MTNEKFDKIVEEVAKNTRITKDEVYIRMQNELKKHKSFDFYLINARGSDEKTKSII